jgi:hypothetical protein
MRRTRAFRPVVGEALESRTVLSTLDTTVANLISSVPLADTQLANTAFVTFEQTYIQDMQNVLLPAGTTNPAANRPAFDAAVASALTTLNTSLDSAIHNLPSAPTLSATFQGALLGAGPGSLQSMLNALTTPTTMRAARQFAKTAEKDIAQIANMVLPQINNAAGPAKSVDVATVEQDMNQIGTVLQTFIQSYQNSEKTILVPAGTTNPAANRPAFDQAVGTALTTLNAGVASALSNMPPALTPSLTAIVRRDLLTGTPPTGTSLQETLAAVPSPASARRNAINKFLRQATVAFSSAENHLSSDILAAIKSYNSAL